MVLFLLDTYNTNLKVEICDAKIVALPRHLIEKFLAETEPLNRNGARQL